MAEVLIYSTPWCPYCERAKRLLEGKGVNYVEIRVDLDPMRWDEMVARSQRSTVPQIFIDGLHVGGCDDLLALEQSEELDPLLGGGGERAN